MKKILILHFHHHNDPRARREYDILSSKYHMSGLGYGISRKFDFIIVSKPKWTFKMKLIQRFWLLLRCYERVYWNLPQVKEAEEKLKDKEFDVIIAHNEESIPLALKYKKMQKSLQICTSMLQKNLSILFGGDFILLLINIIFAKPTSPKLIMSILFRKESQRNILKTMA